MEFFNDIGNALHQAFIEEQRYLMYFEGMTNTLLVSLVALLLGTLIGIIVAMIKYKSANLLYLKPLSWFFNLYVFIIRGTPVFLQLFILYYLIFTGRDHNPIIVGGVCFGINSGAYMAEIMRAGIQSVEKGQMEAARSLGLNENTSLINVILPQAIKNILPALGNEFIVLVKETAVVGAITVMDVTKAAQRIGGKTYDVLTPLFIAAAFYLIVVYALSALLSLAERRLKRSDRR